MFDWRRISEKEIRKIVGAIPWIDKLDIVVVTTGCYYGGGERYLYLRALLDLVIVPSLWRGQRYHFGQCKQPFKSISNHADRIYKSDCKNLFLEQDMKLREVAVSLQLAFSRGSQKTFRIKVRAAFRVWETGACVELWVTGGFRVLVM